LHQPHNLAPVKTILAMAPHLVQVGCFDTAFHAGQPTLAQAFALPPEITDRGIRRYGFHGLSYEYVASVLPHLDPGLAQARVITAHLGSGAGLCAMLAGQSVATTTGFTAVDGLPMGTRCGALDPGVILYLLDELKMGPREIKQLLYEKSGLLGVSGISSDMRTLERSQDPRAQLAIDLFVYRIGREIGSLAAALGGVDALVFTAGIGEHSASIRRSVCLAASWLGVTLDEAANNAGATRISSPESRVSVWVIPTDEELMIARHCQRVLLTL
jgi:acetate kinase